MSDTSSCTHMTEIRIIFSLIISYKTIRCTVDGLVGLRHRGDFLTALIINCSHRCSCPSIVTGPICGKCSKLAYEDTDTGSCVECGCSVGSSGTSCSDQGRCTCDKLGGGDRLSLADAKCVRFK